jgi:spore germination protein YaaH
MIDEAKKQKYTGWQFDFENINHLDRDMYTAFVKKTYEKLKEENLSFSVAVVVRDREYDPESKNQDWSSAYDYKQLAKYSDFLSLMTYDEPYSSGPVASLPYIEKTLKYMFTQAPAEKLSLGVPMYCWHWIDGVRHGSTTHTLAAKHYRKGKNRESKFDENLGAQYFKFTSKGKENIIWCDTEKGVEKKQEIVDKYGMRGFSFWALGQADNKFWGVLN